MLKHLKKIFIICLVVLLPLSGCKKTDGNLSLSFDKDSNDTSTPDSSEKKCINCGKIINEGTIGQSFKDEDNCCENCCENCLDAYRVLDVVVRNNLKGGKLQSNRFNNALMTIGASFLKDEGVALPKLPLDIEVDGKIVVRMHKKLNGEDKSGYICRIQISPLDMAKQYYYDKESKSYVKKEPEEQSY